MKTLFRTCLLLSLLISFTGCTSKEVSPQDYVNSIKEACTKQENSFPAELLSVEFLEYFTPNDRDNCFHHTVRFGNESGNPLELNILGFYDSSLDKWIIARGGSLQPSDDGPLTLQTGEGWVFDNQFTLLYPWKEYTSEERETMQALAERLYFQVSIDEETYYLILNFEDRTVITHE